MKDLIQKYLLIPVSLTLLALVYSPVHAAGGCSIYLGEASLNELFKDNPNQSNDADDFVEIKIINPTLAFATFSQWTVQLCERDDRGNSNDNDGCSASISLGSFADSTPPWLVLKDGSIGSFFNYSTGFDAILLDENDDVVDYLSVDGYTLQEQAGCTGTALAFPYQASAPGASVKFVFRSPDGSGPWGGPSSASALPTEGASNDGVVAPSLDHFSITPATTNGSTCLANAITIIAENGGNNPVANYTNTIQISVSTGHGNWSINNADGVLNPNPDTDDNGTVNYSFVTSDASEIVLDLSNTHAETVTITVSDSSEGVTSTSVAINFSRNVFIITEDPIQVAGRPQAMIVEMWTDDAAASPSCSIDTNYNSSTQSLQASINRFTVLTSAVDPSINGVSIPEGPGSAAIELDFSLDPGRATFNLDTTDVGQYELTLSDTTLIHSASVISGSTSLLTVRPFGFAVTGIEVGAGPPPKSNTGTTDPADPEFFTTAGSDFSATISAVLWQAGDDTEGGLGDGVIDIGASYNNNSVAPSYAWDTDLTVLSTGGFPPAPGGVVGILNNGNIAASEFTGGSRTLTDLQYTEVGSFTLQSLASDYLGVASADIVGHDIIVGRFIPDHFVLSDMQLVNRSDDPLCASNFTYLEENFQVSFDLSAMSAGGANVTLNYTTASGFAKLDTASELNYGAVDSTLPVDLTTRLQTGTPVINFVAGVANDLTDILSLDRLATGPDGPFDLSVGIAPADEDGTQLNSFNLDVAGAGNDHGLIDSTTLKYGRATLDNVFGSELITLNMPLQIESFNAGIFASNTDDNCTGLATTNLILSNNVETGQVDGNIQVLAGQTSIATMAVNPVVMGNTGLLFCPPGNPACTPTSGNVGFIDVSIDLTGLNYPWLQYDWNGDGSFDNDPTATATFGIYKGNDVNIYIQQIFQQP